MRIVSILTLGLLAFASGRLPAEESARVDRAGLSRRLAKMTYIHEGDATPAAYVRSHPCVVGTWRFRGETKSHWIGDVHYISDNTKKASTRYVAFGLKVAKSDAVKVDLRKWSGRILLEKASKNAAVDDRLGRVQPFHVVAYDAKGGAGDGVIDLYEELPYSKAK